MKKVLKNGVAMVNAVIRDLGFYARPVSLHFVVTFCLIPVHTPRLHPNHARDSLSCVITFCGSQKQTFNVPAW